MLWLTFGLGRSCRVQALELIQRDHEFPAEFLRCSKQTHSIHPRQADTQSLFDGALQHRSDVMLTPQGGSIMQLLFSQRQKGFAAAEAVEAD